MSALLLSTAAAAGAIVLAGWTLWRLHRRMELVARAVHELRAPLCAARLAVHAAARDGGWPAVAPVDRELERAARALEDLGAARRGERADDHVECLDVAGVLDDVRETWAPLAWPVRREIRIDRSCRGLTVRADRARLAQAIGNLVGNALEHGAGPVVLRAREAGSRVRIEVEDRGGGLPAPLETLTRRARGGRGARGRGLAIAAEIARRSGGALRADRTTSACRLVLELPLADAERRRIVPARTAVAATAADVDLLAALRVGGTVRPAGARRRPARRALR